MADTEKLSPPYDAYLQNEEWDKYIAALSREGMFWWFNLDIRTLHLHLTPLLRATDLLTLPDRLVLLSQVVDHRIDADELGRFYADFLQNGDPEAAAAAATAAVRTIWESGRDFGRFDAWYEKIDALVSGRLQVPPVAKASLMWCQCLVEFAAVGDLHRAAASAVGAVSWSRRSGSNNLRVYNAMMYIYACLWNADLCRLESSITDARIMCGLSDVSFVPRAAFQFMFGLYLLLFGNLSDSRRELEAIVAHDETNGLSDHLWLLGHFNALHVASAQGDAAWIERIVAALRRRGVDESTFYQASLHHFILGAARLSQGKTDKALEMARTALDFGRRTGSPVPEHHISLLMAQIFSETGDIDAAMDLLEQWKPIWLEQGYNLYVITAHLEIARIRIRRGDMDGARRAYDEATRLWVYGKEPHAMHRPRAFVRNIRSALVRKPDVWAVYPSGGPPAVAIKTFGGLRIHMNGAAIDGDRWRGQKTRDLLKALIVFGGSKISSDRITDALWPDADGAQAAGNLKVTLSRLRRIGCEKGEKPPQWILVRHKRISLARRLCGVDAFRFRECIARGMETDMDVERLKEAVDLYKADFLPNDRDADWIADHRRTLRTEYAAGVARLAERYLRMARAGDAAAVLGSAVEKTGLDGDLCALLMQAHLDMDRPDKARDVFHAAAEKFQTDLGIDPDPKLVSFARTAGLL